jgi:uncharacterized protein YbaP (TraB family)
MSFLAKIFTLCIALVFSNVILAANDRGLVWKVTKNSSDKSSSQTNPTIAYIVGSIHLAKDDFYPLRPEIEKAFQQSDTLVVEVDITEQNTQVNEWLMANGLYKPPETLRDHLPTATYQRLERFINRESLSTDDLLQQRPALLGISVSLYQLKELGMNPALGLDQHFLQAAHQNKKPIRSLETINDQLTALFAFPDDALMVEQLLDQAEQLPILMNDMTSAWKSGDANALSKLLLDQNNEKNAVRFKPLMEAMFYQRNRRMAEKIDDWLQEGGRYFIVVGSGHLVGEDNLIDLLRQKGYSLSRY